MATTLDLRWDGVISPVWHDVLPVLSTAHLSKETADWLTACKLGPCVAVTQDGFFVHLSYFAHNHWYMDRRVPEQLTKLARTVRAQVWVRFDSCGDRLEDLPEFDW